MKKKNIILSALITFILLFGIALSCSAQIYISEISENQYNKISIGDYFYEGQIQLTDGSWHQGWISRFPDSNRLRFRSYDDSTQIFLLTNKYVKSFSYNLKDSIPQFVFKQIPINKRRSETKAIELLIKGDITLYVYKTVEKISYTNGLLQRKHEYQMLTSFYLEKDGELHLMEDFESDLYYLIKDKREYSEQYRKTKKKRRDRKFTHYINAVIAYNETE